MWLPGLCKRPPGRSTFARSSLTSGWDAMASLVYGLGDPGERWGDAGRIAAEAAAAAAAATRHPGPLSNPNNLVYSLQCWTLWHAWSTHC